MRYDLCLASNWEYDADFIRLLNAACASNGLTLLVLTPASLPASLPLLATGEAGFSLLLDRASEADPAYLPLVDIARSTGARRLNPRELADRAYDKAFMHRLFYTAGIPTPRTVILPPFLENPLLTPDLSSLEGCFTAKPALGGGGEGVVTELSTLEQVQQARQGFPEQRYLLQAHIHPKELNGLPAWFRVLYCLGEIHPCFWNTTTHVYTPVFAGGHTAGGHTGPPQPTIPPQPVGTVLRDCPNDPNNPTDPNLENLWGITRRIAHLCGLELFSTEIALTEDGQFLVVDYVNDPIDLRLQSRAKDGVPDFIVERIAEKVAEETKNQVS